MPTAYVEKLAKEYNVSIAEAEGVWEQAKESVDKINDKYPWAIVMSVFKRMMAQRYVKHHKTKIVVE